MPAPSPTPPAPNPPAPAAPPVKDQDEINAEEALKKAFDPGTPDPVDEEGNILPFPGIGEKKEEPAKEQEKKKEEPAIEKKEEPVKEEPADELDSPPEGVVQPKPDSKSLRAQLEVRNTEFKKLTGEHSVLKEEMETLRKENETLKKSAESRVDEPDRTDYVKEPSVRKLWDPVIESLHLLSDKIGGKEGQALESNFQSYLETYHEAAKGRGTEEGRAALEKLQERVAADLGDENRRDVMSFLGIQALPGYKQAMQEIDSLKKTSGERRIRQGVEKYTKASEEIGKVLDPLGELPADVIAAKPHTIEAYVSSLITSDPKWLARSQMVKKEVVELLAGAKPLTPEEKAALEANDAGSLSDAEEARAKKYVEKRNLMAKRLYLHLMVHPNMSALLEELATLRNKTQVEDDEMDVLERIPLTPPPKPKPKAPEERDLKADLYKVFAGQDLPDPEE